MDGISIMTNPGLEVGGIGAMRSSGQTDSDRESIVSDYSEMADPVKEHLASIHILQEAELRFGSGLGLSAQQSYAVRPWLSIQRRPDEDEAEFLQRQRKVNFLSLAQEFAAIKKANPHALPFNLHRQRNDVSDNEEASQECDEVSLAQEFAAVSFVDKTSDDCSEQVRGHSGFHTSADDVQSSQSSDVVTNDVLCDAREDCDSELGQVVCSIPDVVQGLHDSTPCDASNGSKQPDANCAEVDPATCRSPDVRSGFDDDFKTSDELVVNTVISYSKNMDLMRQQQQRENIRLKLVLSDADDYDTVFGSDSIVLPSEITSCRSSSASLSMCFMNAAAFDDDDDDDDVDCCHEELGAGPLGSPDLIAGMRRPVQQEFVSRDDGRDNDASFLGPVKELGREALSHLSEGSIMKWKLDRFDRLSLRRLNTAQLQVVVNEQLSQIEALNNELVECLVERDDLHRKQDSLLVDVEDLSRFLTKVTCDEDTTLQLETP